MLFIVIGLLSFSFINQVAEKILPPINNIYKTKITIPFIGNQNIEYERIKKYESQVRLNGIINDKGSIYINKENIYDYSFDEVLQKIINKYKCEIYNPYYDYEDDIIKLKIKINLINFRKTLFLKKS